MRARRAVLVAEDPADASALAALRELLPEAELDCLPPSRRVGRVERIVVLRDHVGRGREWLLLRCLAARPERLWGMTIDGELVQLAPHHVGELCLDAVREKLLLPARLCYFLLGVLGSGLRARCRRPFGDAHEDPARHRAPRWRMGSF